MNERTMQVAETVLEQIDEARTIVEENLGSFERIFGRCYSGPLRRFLNEVPELLEDLKAEIE